MDQLQFGLARDAGSAAPHQFGTLQSMGRLDPLDDVPALARAQAAAGQPLQEPVLAQFASRGLAVLQAFQRTLEAQAKGASRSACEAAQRIEQLAIAAGSAGTAQAVGGEAARASHAAPAAAAQLTDAAARKVAQHMGQAAHIRERLARIDRTRLGILLLLPFLMLLEMAIAYQFNSLVAPGANPLTEPTWLDHAARATAALMMLVSISGVVLMTAQSLQTRGSAARRVLALLLLAALACGVVMLVASISFPAFGRGMEELVSGAASASGMESADAPASSLPLALRLLSSAPLLLVGLMAGMAELAALRLGEERCELRSTLAEHEVLLQLDERRALNLQTALECEAQAAELAQPETRRTKLTVALSEGIAAYCAQLQHQRQPALDEGRANQAKRLAHQRQEDERQHLLQLVQALQAANTVQRVVEAAVPEQVPAAAGFHWPPHAQGRVPQGRLNGHTHHATQ